MDEDTIQIISKARLKIRIFVTKVRPLISSLQTALLFCVDKARVNTPLCYKELLEGAYYQNDWKLSVLLKQMDLI